MGGEAGSLRGSGNEISQYACTLMPMSDRQPGRWLSCRPRSPSQSTRPNYHHLTTTRKLMYLDPPSYGSIHGCIPQDGGGKEIIFHPQSRSGGQLVEAGEGLAQAAGVSR